MTREQIDMLLAEVFAGVFRRTIEISQPLTRENIEDWDSLKHMEIVFALEAATGLVFSEDEIVEIKSVDDLRQRLSATHAA